VSDIPLHKPLAEAWRETEVVEPDPAKATVGTRRSPRTKRTKVGSVAKAAKHLAGQVSAVPE